MGLDIYQAVTDRIIELLDRGTAPWRHPIREGGGAGGREGSGSFPANLASGRNYRGINVFLLAITAWIEGYESPYWLTFRQARERGGSVRKREKGSLVIFWKQCATKDAATGDEVTIPVLRHYTVFNAEQCEGIAAPGAPEPDPAALPFEPIEAAARIVERYTEEGGGPRIQHRGRRASYWPREDFVQIAEPEWFVDPESYYATMFHELAHSTGHSSRLDRGLEAAPPSFGSPDYSKEELVAEMGAAFLAAASLKPAHDRAVRGLHRGMAKEARQRQETRDPGRRCRPAGRGLDPRKPGLRTGVTGARPRYRTTRNDADLRAR